MIALWGPSVTGYCDFIDIESDVDDFKLVKELLDLHGVDGHIVALFHRVDVHYQRRVFSLREWTGDTKPARVKLPNVERCVEILRSIPLELVDECRKWVDNEVLKAFDGSSRDDDEEDDDDDDDDESDTCGDCGDDGNCCNACGHTCETCCVECKTCGCCEHCEMCEDCKTADKTNFCNGERL